MPSQACTRACTHAPERAFPATYIGDGDLVLAVTVVVVEHRGPGTRANQRGNINCRLSLKRSLLPTKQKTMSRIVNNEKRDIFRENHSYLSRVLTTRKRNMTPHSQKSHIVIFVTNPESRRFAFVRNNYYPGMRRQYSLCNLTRRACIKPAHVKTNKQECKTT